MRSRYRTSSFEIVDFHVKGIEIVDFHAKGLEMRFHSHFTPVCGRYRTSSFDIVDFRAKGLDVDGVRVFLNKGGRTSRWFRAYE